MPDCVVEELFASETDAGAHMTKVTADRSRSI